MNIFMIGQNDPAGMMVTFANAINRYTEHTARILSYRTVYQNAYEYDIELPRLIDEDYDEIEWLLKTSDVFHFHMLLDETFQIGPLHLKDYVEGKKIVYHHHGTYDHQCFLGRVDQYRERYRTANSSVLVSTPDLLEHLPMAEWQPNLVPLYDVHYLPRADHLGEQEEIRIVQAPTRRWHKHTKEFLSVTSDLKSEYPNVSVSVLEGMSHIEVLKRKRRSHISFDHMNGWFGICSLESLAHGIPTIAGLDQHNREHIERFVDGATLPWIIARNEKELFERMKELVIDPERRVSLGAQSRAFMEERWDETRVVARLIEYYER
ncbi:MAG: hypothetical protein KDD64_11485 [Bdellovibrionales bacterium]|nr:hypothetical protein [Bdellovibrionales bacterium]